MKEKCETESSMKRTQKNDGRAGEKYTTMCARGQTQRLLKRGI
jgi:hypothetical protein